MREIPLTRGLHTIIDDDDFDLIKQHKWCANKIGNTFYVQHSFTHPGGRKGALYMHRVIMNPPSNMDVDHLDGDGLNNRRSNLRICTRGQNCGRQKPQVGRSSKFKGVSYHRRMGCWEAYVHSKDKKHPAGYFSDERKAAMAYNELASVLHGEFALLNEIM